jgi:hypothetical protein
MGGKKAMIAILVVVVVMFEGRRRMRRRIRCGESRWNLLGEYGERRRPRQRFV